jgi:hypothetical protein
MLELLMSRNGAGRLVLTLPDGQVHEGIVPVRAFPVNAPDGCLALMSADGKELCWIEDPATLPEDVFALVQEEISTRELMPVISSIISVSTFSTPSTWLVATDRGNTQFVLKGEEDIRRLFGSMLIITDSHGLRFLLRDMLVLDKTSRKILDRFL